MLRDWCAPLRHARGVASLAAIAFAFAASTQEPAPRITLIELTPHLAVNDAAALIEAEKYADAIVILDGFIANQSQQVPEAFYLLGVAHYKLGDYAKARAPAERAATLASDAPVSWLELSVAYERVGDFERSLATMRLAQQAGLLTDDGDFRRLSDLLVHQGLPFQGAEVLGDALEAQTVRADEAAYTKLGTAWFMAGIISGQMGWYGCAAESPECPSGGICSESRPK